MAYEVITTFLGVGRCINFSFFFFFYRRYICFLLLRNDLRMIYDFFLRPRSVRTHTCIVRHARYIVSDRNTRRANFDGRT
jgi:hypothetical protein